jgi:hypothetical protein
LAWDPLRREEHQAVRAGMGDGTVEQGLNRLAITPSSPAVVTVGQRDARRRG